MKVSAATVLIAGALLLAAPASAQYYPTNPPPPPQYYPPPQRLLHAAVLAPPPPAGLLPAGAHGGGEAALHHSAVGRCGLREQRLLLRLLLHVLHDDVFVQRWLRSRLAQRQPRRRIWVRPTLGITIGANVMWGTYTPSSVIGVPNNSIYSTTWEPHVDFLLGYPANEQVKWPCGLGLGLYIAEANGNNASGQNVQYNALGGAFRAGFGATFLPHSKVGIGIDAIFEGGWIGSSYVSTVQLLVGPELHF